jgi:hypothetical protein
MDSPEEGFNGQMEGLVATSLEAVRTAEIELEDSFERGKKAVEHKKDVYNRLVSATENVNVIHTWRNEKIQAIKALRDQTAKEILTQPDIEDFTKAAMIDALHYCPLDENSTTYAEQTMDALYALNEQLTPGVHFLIVGSRKSIYGIGNESPLTVNIEDPLRYFGFDNKTFSLNGQKILSVDHLESYGLIKQRSNERGFIQPPKMTTNHELYISRDTILEASYGQKKLPKLDSSGLDFGNLLIGEDYIRSHINELTYPQTFSTWLAANKLGIELPVGNLPEFWRERITADTATLIESIIETMYGNRTSKLEPGALDLETQNRLKFLLDSLDISNDDVVAFTLERYLRTLEANRQHEQVEISDIELEQSNLNAHKLVEGIVSALF